MFFMYHYQKNIYLIRVHFVNFYFEIIEGVTSLYGLHSSDVCPITIRQRETRSDDVIVNQMHGGHVSPMVIAEDKYVGLIIIMARIRHPLTLSTFFKLAKYFFWDSNRKRCD